MLNNLTNLIYKKIGPLGIFIFPSSIQYKTDSFERFDLFLCFDSIASEEWRGKRYFLKILLEDIRLTVTINKQINDFCPSLEGFTAANKEIFLIENL